MNADFKSCKVLKFIIVTIIRDEESLSWNTDLFYFYGSSCSQCYGFEVFSCYLPMLAL